LKNIVTNYPSRGNLSDFFVYFYDLDFRPEELKNATSAYLWVDAISINQNDKDERAYQVPPL
jgi:Heterokaryon incompatibility protein (HET)